MFFKKAEMHNAREPGPPGNRPGYRMSLNPYCRNSP